MSGAKRTRRTKAQMQAIREGIVDLAQDHQPCTVRQIYYLGIGRYWDKDTGRSRKHYDTVVRYAGDLREAGDLPGGWIADNTRWVRQDTMYYSAADALDRWAESYRRDLWAAQPRRVEVWCESDSIAGVIDRVTRPSGVGLFVARGQASKTFVYEAVQSYRHIGKPVSIIYVGDWDPSGLAIPLSVEERIQRYGDDDLDLEFERIAVTASDVASGDLIGHSANMRDSNYRRFADHCRVMGLDPQTAVEVEAIPPERLRQRVRDALDVLAGDVDAWNATIAAERSEREIFQRMAESFGGAA